MQWLRRVLLAAFVTVVGVLLFGRLSRRGLEQPAGVAEWPPIEPRSPTPSPALSQTTSQQSEPSTPTHSRPTPAPPDMPSPREEVADEPAGDEPAGDETSADETSADETVEVQLLADAPPTLTETPEILIDRPPGEGDAWVLRLADGGCPEGYPVKANDDSGIFHLPGGRFYDRTHAERCYARAEDAEADGYRQAKA